MASAGPEGGLGASCLMGGTGLCLGWKNGWTGLGVHADEDPEAGAFLAADIDLVGVWESVGLVTESVEMGVLASVTGGFAGAMEFVFPDTVLVGMGVLVSVDTGFVGVWEPVDPDAFLGMGVFVSGDTDFVGVTAGLETTLVDV